MSLFLLTLFGCPDAGEPKQVISTLVFEPEPIIEVETPMPIDLYTLGVDDDGGILNLPPEKVCTRNKLGEPFCYGNPYYRK